MMAVSNRFRAPHARSARPTRVVATAAALTGCALIAMSCSTTGLSTRDPAGTAYPQVVSALADPGLLASSSGTSADTTAQPARPVPPLKVAVAQLGEIAPPKAVIDRLIKEPGLFAVAEPLTAPAFDGPSAWSYRSGPGSAVAQREAVRHAIVEMRNLARDMGCDYVFAFGGTCDRATTDTPLSLADLTIVGAFVVPSKEIRAEGRAAGALIDVRSGRVVMTVSASADDTRLAASVAREHDELALVTSLRDKMVTDLADRLVQRVKRGEFGAATSGPTARGAVIPREAPATPLVRSN
jgi:hypothetical protein